MRALTEQVRALPGVTSAAVTDRLPLAGPSGSAIMVEGDTRPRQARQSAAIQSTDGDYLDTMGIRVTSGRAITPADNGRRVAVVSRTAVARLWPQQEPLGQRSPFSARMTRRSSRWSASRRTSAGSRWVRSRLLISTCRCPRTTTG